MLCIPAIIVLLLLILLVIFEIYIFGFYILDFIGNIIFTIFVVFIINWICSSESFSWLSWVIAIFSIFLLVVAIFYLKNKTRSEIKDEIEKDMKKDKDNKSNNLSFCSIYDKSQCSSISACNWAGNECITESKYENNLNKLTKECSNRGKNCKSDERCYLFDSMCGPSLIGTGDLLNKKDCISIITNDYKNMLEKLPLKEQESRVKKDNPFFLKSFENIDASGCGVVMQDMTQKLYGNKMY